MEENKIKQPPVKVLVIGGSAGSLNVLLKLVPQLAYPLPIAIVFVLHRKYSTDSGLADLFTFRTLIPVCEIEEKQKLVCGNIYIAPADYHVLFEKDHTFSLDFSEKVNFSRPSIDVSFESAAEVFGPCLTCLLLSGASADGVEGLKYAKEKGAQISVQDPATAEFSYMPQQAVLKVDVDRVLKTEDMSGFINSL